jgi:HSP20 family molecular chaperone IbpA
MDMLIKDLNDLIAHVLSTTNKNTNYTRPHLPLINISVDMHAKTLDDSLYQNMLKQNLRPTLEQDPLIDIFEDKKSLKIVALLPGIKKDEVSLNVGDGFVELEIRKGSQVYRKMIPCNVKPSNVSIKSTAYNNSILEMVFNKTQIRADS